MSSNVFYTVTFLKINLFSVDNLTTLVLAFNATFRPFWHFLNMTEWQISFYLIALSSFWCKIFFNICNFSIFQKISYFVFLSIPVYHHYFRELFIISVHSRYIYKLQITEKGKKQSLTDAREKFVSFSICLLVKVYLSTNF